MHAHSRTRSVRGLFGLALALLAGPVAKAQPETTEAVARDLFGSLLTDEASLADRPHLRARDGLMEATRLAGRQEWDRALTAFRDYYMRKLADTAGQLGIPDDLADPFTDYNGAFKAVVDRGENPRRKAIANADRLVERGPGPNEASHWGGGFANPLLQAYVYTKEPRYLDRWCDLMDDWVANENYLATLRPLYMQPADSKGATSAFQMMRLLRAAAMATPDGHSAMRPDSLARVLAKLMRLYPSTTRIYHSSNPRNWINENAFFLCYMGALWDEFKLGESTLEHGRIMFERYGSTHVLRDGTEIQRLFGYNFMYLKDGSHTTRLIDSLYPNPDLAPAWKRAVVRSNWVEAQRDHLRERARYLLRMSTPDQGLPIGMRGDYRTTNFQDLRPFVSHDPSSLAILAAYNKQKPNQPLPPPSDAFPYGGYFWQREGWGPGSGHALLINYPQMGDNGFLARSANNAFGLSMYGMDMLEIGVDGVYSIRPSPLKVDGLPQNLGAGLLTTHNEPTEPIATRWLASTAFDLAETLYQGPYARNSNSDDPAEMANLYQQAIKDVAHRRQLIFLRQAKLWLCIDRLHTDSERSYELIWQLPGPPASKKEVRTFAPDAIQLDRAQETVHTQAQGQPNLSLYHVGGEALALAKRPFKGRPTKLTSPTEIPVAWKGRGEQVVATLIHPRPNMQASLQQIQRIREAGAIGFNAEAADGLRLMLRTARSGRAALAAGSVQAHGELLLVQGAEGAIEGLALGCTSLAIAGRTVPLDQPDVQFSVRDGKLAVDPILGPVWPVEILPSRLGFVAPQDITLSCKTPGVEIRYTLDGSEPTPASTLYAGPFTLRDSALVRARAYRTGLDANPPETSQRRASPPSRAYYENLAPAQARSTPGLEPGLWAEFYRGHWLDMVQGLDRFKPVERRAVAALFDKWEGVPAPETFRKTSGEKRTPRSEAPPPYGLRYTGFLEVPAGGVYTFRAPEHYMRDNLAGGYELIVTLAGQTWQPAMGRHGFGTWSIALEPGPHPIRVDYVDYRGSAVADFHHPSLRVNWIWNGAKPPLTIQGPGVQEQPIPTAWLKRQDR